MREERHQDQHELPEAREGDRRRAIRLAWISIVYILTAVAFLFVTRGESQAMLTALIEDALALIPPLAFLVAWRFRERPANKRFPYGYHRSISIAFLCAALALFVFGAYLLFAALRQLLTLEHPSIGIVQVFGHEVWLGWFMLLALAWSGIPMVLLGRAKRPLGRRLHDKALYADAEMNRDNWVSIAAAMLGIVGIGFGLWWADGAAAAIISVGILRDGVRNLRAVGADLMDAAPQRVDHGGADPLPTRVETEIRRLDWVEDVRVRLRDEGHVFFGEVLVVPVDERNLIDRLRSAGDLLRELDWRLYDVVVVPVRELDRNWQD